jgi:hypothetical protein
MVQADGFCTGFMSGTDQSGEHRPVQWAGSKSIVAGAVSCNDDQFGAHRDGGTAAQPLVVEGPVQRAVGSRGGQPEERSQRARKQRDGRPL